MTERKRAIVEKVFKQLDRDGSGFITVKDVLTQYDVSNLKEFQDGKKTKE